LTLASAGDAVEVDVDATLAFTATPDETLNTQHYRIVWSVDDETKGTVVDTQGTSNTLTGVAAGTVNVTAEIKQVSWVDGVLTLTSFDTPISDTIEITVSEV